MRERRSLKVLIFASLLVAAALVTGGAFQTFKPHTKGGGKITTVTHASFGTSSDEQLAAESDVIVEGVIRRIGRPAKGIQGFDNDHKSQARKNGLSDEDIARSEALLNSYQYTPVNLDVESVLKGDVRAGTLVFKQFAGVAPTDDQVKQGVTVRTFVNGLPEYSEGEHVVVFLQYLGSKNQLDPIGVYRVEAGTAVGAGMGIDRTQSLAELRSNIHKATKSE